MRCMELESRFKAGKELLQTEKCWNVFNQDGVESLKKERQARVKWLTRTNADIYRPDPLKTP